MKRSQPFQLRCGRCGKKVVRRFLFFRLKHKCRKR